MLQQDNPKDYVKPLGIYGKSKAKGEEYVLKWKNNYVVRTSWLYGDFGKNFCLTMLRLHKEKSLAKQPLRVVSDQIGAPTSTYSLSRFCWKIIDSLSKSKIIPSLLHWSDAGVASWFDFAFAIGEIGVEKGLISEAAKVIPIKSDAYKTLAKRPHFSLLNCEESTKILKENQFHWREELKKVMEEIKKCDPDVTVITIAHRLSTLKDCDEIFYFEDGELKDHGKFEELVSSNQQFRKLAEV